MTNEKMISRLLELKAEIEWNHSSEYQVALEAAIKLLMKNDEDEEKEEEKCDCYATKEEMFPLYNQFSGRLTNYYKKEVGYCNGTREQDACDCNGLRKNCTFYPEIRDKANRKF